MKGSGGRHRSGDRAAVGGNSTRNGLKRRRSVVICEFRVGAETSLAAARLASRDTLRGVWRVDERRSCIRNRFPTTCCGSFACSNAQRSTGTGDWRAADGCEQDGGVGLAAVPFCCTVETVDGRHNSRGVGGRSRLLPLGCYRCRLDLEICRGDLSRGFTVPGRVKKGESVAVANER